MGEKIKNLPRPAIEVPLKSKAKVINLNDQSNILSSEIEICHNKLTYIWQTNGKGYWSYLIYINKYYVYGYKWNGACWYRFAVRIKKIEAFICY